MSNFEKNQFPDAKALLSNIKRKRKIDKSKFTFSQTKNLELTIQHITFKGFKPILNFNIFFCIDFGCVDSPMKSVNSFLISKYLHYSTT